jgi:hypothetical protein
MKTISQYQMLWHGRRNLQRCSRSGGNVSLGKSNSYTHVLPNGASCYSGRGIILFPGLSRNVRKEGVAGSEAHYAQTPLSVVLTGLNGRLRKSRPMNTLKTIEEDGFGVFPELLLPPETRRLIDDLDQSPLRRSKAGVRHALRHPSVAALARESRLLNIAQEILGAEARPFRATLFDKSPQANWLVVWHQDTALPLRNRHDTPGWGPWSVKDGVVYAHAPASVLRQILALRHPSRRFHCPQWAVEGLAGTHPEGVLSDNAIHEFAAQVEPTDCLVPQGGVLAIRPLLIHASSKSQSDGLRRVLHIKYSASIIVGEGLELAVA